jgi:hypothetical protein
MLVSPGPSPLPSPRHASTEPITPRALASEDKVAVVEPPPPKAIDTGDGAGEGAGHKRSESTASNAGTHHHDGDGSGSDDEGGGRHSRASSTAHLSPAERQAMEAKKEFFFLTALATKLNSKLRVWHFHQSAHTIPPHLNHSIITFKLTITISYNVNRRMWSSSQRPSYGIKQ